MIKKNRAELQKGTLTLIVITAMISASLFTGCGEDDAYATTPAKLVVNGTEVAVPYIAVIDGKEISLDEYRYYFLSLESVMAGGDTSYWDEDSGGHKLSGLKNLAMQAMKETYAVKSLAKELKLSLTKDEKFQIDEDVRNQISTLGGSREYVQALDESYLTDELYRFLWSTNFYCEKLWAYYFGYNGPYYIENADGALSDSDLGEQYTIKFKAIITEAADGLSVELAPEYDLITVDSLR